MARRSGGVIHEVQWLYSVSQPVELADGKLALARPGDILVCMELPCGCCDDVLRIRRPEKGDLQ